VSAARSVLPCVLAGQPCNRWLGANVELLHFVQDHSLEGNTQKGGRKHDHTQHRCYWWTGRNKRKTKSGVVASSCVEHTAGVQDVGLRGWGGFCKINVCNQSRRHSVKYALSYWSHQNYGVCSSLVALYQRFGEKYCLHLQWAPPTRHITTCVKTSIRLHSQSEALDTTAHLGNSRTFWHAPFHSFRSLPYMPIASSIASSSQGAI
jgi:hypothetical protein